MPLNEVPTPAEIEALATRLEADYPVKSTDDLRLAARLARGWVIAASMLTAETKRENWLAETFDFGAVDSAYCAVCGGHQKYDGQVEHEADCRIKAAFTALAAVEGAK